MNATELLPHVPTALELIAYAESLNPKGAIVSNLQVVESRCSTPLVTAMVDYDGTTIDLNLDNSKYLAIYLRVSSDEQAENGWSVGDQARRGIQYAAGRKLAFRIFTDASLTGWLPFMEPQIVEEMLELKAERYCEAFDNVYLNAYNTYSDAEQRQLRAHRERKRQNILDGILLLNEDPNSPEMKRRGTYKKAIMFRPALTLMIRSLSEIHEIAVTDGTRLSRNHALTMIMGRKLLKHDVSVTGLVKPIVRAKDVGGKMVTVLLALLAEEKLYDVCEGVMRGHERMMSAGKRPHASVPNWIERDSDGNANFKIEQDGQWKGKEARRMAIQRIIELFLDGPDPGNGGPKQLAYAMIEEGYPDPKGKGWQIRTIHQMLTSRTLLGEQECYGLRHQVMPAVCDELTFDKIQHRLFLRRRLSAYDGVIDGEVRLGAKLLRCVCGRKMVCTPSRNSYCCPVTLHSRLDKSVRHTVVKINDWHRFLDELMTSHVIDMLVEHESDDDRSEAIQTAIEITTRELLRAQEEREAQRQSVLSEVKLGIAKMGMDEYDPMYVSTKDALIGSKVRAYTDQVNRLNAELDKHKMERDTYVPPVAFVEYEDQLKRWCTLSESQKNRLICTVFAEFRASGAELEQFITPVRRSALNPELPPISLIVKRRGINFDRRFPIAHSWVSDLRRVLKGKEWFGEFKNFTWTNDIRGEDFEEDEHGNKVTVTATTVPWE